MTYGQKVAYLKEYRTESERVRRLVEERTALYGAGGGAGAALGGGGAKGVPAVDRVQKTVEALYDLDAEISRAQARQQAARQRVEAALAGIGNKGMRRYMRYYYLEGMTWVAVADCAGYCREHMSRLHRGCVEGMQL